MTLSPKIADRFIESAVLVRFTTIHGESFTGRVVSRDRRTVDVESDGIGGRYERSALASWRALDKAPSAAPMVQYLQDDGATWSPPCPLRHCFPDAGYDAALFDLTATGEHVCGGGAAPMYALRLARTESEIEAERAATRALNEWWQNI